MNGRQGTALTLRLIKDRESLSAVVGAFAPDSFIPGATSGFGYRAVPYQHIPVVAPLLFARVLGRGKIEITQTMPQLIDLGKVQDVVLQLEGIEYTEIDADGYCR